MSKAERLEIIREIERTRASKVITYITSTRANVGVQMAMDCIRVIYEHLKDINQADRPNIDLFLVSNGGDGTVPWKLVTLIREYAERFSVLIPSNAFSAATLTALGADSIIMHPMGMLGPTDPTVKNDFNPSNPNNPAEKYGISVEDVSAYISLIKEDAGITHEDELIEGIKILAQNVHPLALGNVKRSLAQSRMMAKKLLSLHMKDSSDNHTINEIVDNLTSKLYFHAHPINRVEAREQIGLRTVENADPTIQNLMWNLYLEYEKEMKLNVPFNYVFEYNRANINNEPAFEYNIKNILTYIESTQQSDRNIITYKFNNANAQTPLMPKALSAEVIEQGWELEV